MKWYIKCYLNFIRFLWAFSSAMEWENWEYRLKEHWNQIYYKYG